MWVPERRQRDLRQLLIHRHKLVEIRSRVKNGLQHLALVMSQPGVGPITALAFVLTIGDVSRFARSKQVARYLGLIPCEHSSAGHQRLGATSKQGNRFLRMLLVEAAQSAVRCDPEFRREYQHRCHSRPKNVAKVAAARKLAVRLYWMLRTLVSQVTQQVLQPVAVAGCFQPDQRRLRQPAIEPLRFSIAVH